MNYEDTELYFLRRDAGILFGEEKGEKIYQRASKLYTELVVTTDYRKSQTLERQLKTLIYPVIAYYKTLLAVGYRQSDAIEFTAKAVRKCRPSCTNFTDKAIFPSKSLVQPQKQWYNVTLYENAEIERR